MYNKAIMVLKIFAKYGYEAYIVGGYPRDKILGIKTNDIDICTNAKPKEIMEIFDTDISDIKYGSVRIIYKGIKFDVTTYRKEIKYEDNRKPIKIKYINDLKKDLLRRDFTINTLCIDCNGNYIDLLDGKIDIEKHIIKTVGNPRYKLKEDVLRILRAIRFAASLNFDIDEKTKIYIKKYGYLLKNLSSFRKKEELDKIFSAKYKDKGIKLLIDLKLDCYLGINNLDKINICDDIIGIWSQIDYNSDYIFTKNEIDNIKKIREMLNIGINKYTVYKYGLYVSSVVGSITNVSYKEINDIYNNLIIYSRKDIVINGNDIAKILDKEPNSYIKDIMDDIEMKIIFGDLDNKYDILKKYILDNYGG